MHAGNLAGLSIKNPRIRVVRSCKADRSCSTWLGYQWGLTQRSFRDDGVYGDAGKLDGILLPDGITRMMDRSHVNSCGACRNVPYRDAGAGA